jgi:hypothetical protein
MDKLWRPYIYNMCVCLRVFVCARVKIVVVVVVYLTTLAMSHCMASNYEIASEQCNESMFEEVFEA